MNKKAILDNFDHVAKSYDSVLRPLPTKYLDLIQILFSIKQDSWIVDLGCGTGLLTLSLSKICNRVIGVDSSREMIRILKNHDQNKKLELFHCPVEKFDFGNNEYSLIISYESFHLFSTQDKLIKNCEQGLKEGGYLCIGWCTYEWEQILKNSIVEIFESYDIPWGEWGYQQCTNFSSLVRRNCKNLSDVLEKKIQVESKTNVKDIAVYLTSIGKAISLESNKRKHLLNDLEKRFKEVVSGNQVNGFASYCVKYCKKQHN